MTPDALIDALSVPHKEVPTELLRAAAQQRDAVTGPLLDALAAWVEKVEDPDSVWNGQDAWLPDFAMYLLAQFREPRAFPLYLRLCRLPGEGAEYWLGDILTEDMAAFLAATCAGDLEPLRTLIVDEDVYEWSRWAALHALTAVAVCRDASVSEHVRWLLETAQTQRRADDNPFWTMLANAQYELAHPDLTPMLRQAYAEGLPDPMHLALEDIEGRLQEPPGIVLAQTRAEYADTRDAAQRMAWLIEARNRPDDEATVDFDDEEAWFPPQQSYARAAPKVGRNDPCPCGSGKKYKKCCLNADGLK